MNRGAQRGEENISWGHSKGTVPVSWLGTDTPTHIHTHLPESFTSTARCRGNHQVLYADFIHFSTHFIARSGKKKHSVSGTRGFNFGGGVKRHVFVFEVETVSSKQHHGVFGLYTGDCLRGTVYAYLIDEWAAVIQSTGSPSGQVKAGG